MIKKLSLAVCLLAFNSNANMDYFNVNTHNADYYIAGIIYNRILHFDNNEEFPDVNLKPRTLLKERYPDAFKEYEDTFELAIKQHDPISFEYLMESIYIGSICSIRIFEDNVLQNQRANFIKTLSVSALKAKETSTEFKIVCLKSLITYCKDYAKSSGFFNDRQMINNIYLNLQYEKSSPYDNY